MHLAVEGANIYDGLVADGHAVTWGVAQAVNHFPGDDWTHLEWVSFTNWASVGEFVSRFIAAQQSKTPDQLMQQQARWQELTVHGSHYDEISRFGHVSVDETKRPGYIVLGYRKAKPWEAGKVSGIYKQWRAPMMDKLLESGKIVGHGYFERAVSAPGGGWTHVSWTSMESLAGLDAVHEAYVNQASGFTEAEREDLMETVDGAFDLSIDHERILVVTHFHSAGTTGGGGG